MSAGRYGRDRRAIDKAVEQQQSKGYSSQLLLKMEIGTRVRGPVQVQRGAQMAKRRLSCSASGDVGKTDRRNYPPNRRRNAAQELKADGLLTQASAGHSKLRSVRSGRLAFVDRSGTS